MMSSLKFWNKSRSFFCRRYLTCCALQYSEYGEPGRVLKWSERNIDEKSLKPDEVLVKMIAASVNPADINQIQGVYPIKPKLPAFGGSEGLGEVMQCGGRVKGVKAGDWVVPCRVASGTWATHMIGREDDFWQISKKVGVEFAATVRVNTSSAYRMLNDFVELSEGDVVLQNGASSSVGRNVVQIARQLRLHTVNVIRDSENAEQTKAELMTLGADLVLTEKETRGLAKKGVFPFGNRKPPKLALNCVGGKSTLFLASSLADNGVLVTYGGMSMQPVQIPTGPLIFKDISVRGFWMSRWYDDDLRHNDGKKGLEMLRELSGICERGLLKANVQLRIAFKSWQDAFTNEAPGKKCLLLFENF